MSPSTQSPFVRNLLRHVLALGASLFAMSAAGLVERAEAAPIAIDLGALHTSVQSNYQTPSTSFEVTLTENEVLWFTFTLNTAISEVPGIYLDIDTYPSNNHHVDTTIGVYDSDGNRVAVNADAGVVFFAQLSFGDTGQSRGPLTYTVGSETFTANPAIGIDGSLDRGTYYLAVTRFQATFGETDFAVSSNSNGTDTFLLQFRGQAISAIPEPSTYALLGLSAIFLLHRLRTRCRVQG